ncbi:MAG: response regulator [Burkholderiaceae bacterium]|nr:response regulator [Burkholderiaceae bacterium]
MSGETVLVVEDTPANIKLATMLLEKDGYRVLQAENGVDGVGLARLHLPDIILMDIQLPDMDGLAAVKLLREDATTKHLKIVALTAFAMKGDESKMLDSGCDGYIAKPIRYQSFLEEVKRVLSL